MGYDVSAHPVDVELIQNRILPYIRGEGDLSDVLETAVRIAQVRFRANAWGLGLVDLSRAESAARRKKPKPKAKAAGAPKKPKPKPKWLVPDTFDADLHVWGRPFFITSPSEHVSTAIDRYLAATPKQVDAIAKDMLRELNPELVAKVEPSAEGKLPGPKKLAEGLIGTLNIFRGAYPHLATGEPVELPNGNTSDPRELFIHSFPLYALTFATYLQPGWMGRGYVWCTAFIGRAKLKTKLVESPASLFAPLLGNVEGFDKACHATITSNYTVGGYVRPENVPAFREWMDKNTEKMIAACVKEKWDEAGARADFGKVMEALRDAEHRKMGFCEAAEVYSGIMGVMN